MLDPAVYAAMALDEDLAGTMNFVHDWVFHHVLGLRIASPRLTFGTDSGYMVKREFTLSAAGFCHSAKMINTFTDKLGAALPRR